MEPARAVIEVRGRRFDRPLDRGRSGGTVVRLTIPMGPAVGGEESR